VAEVLTFLRTSSSCRLSCALLLSLVLDHHHRETKVAAEMIVVCNGDLVLTDGTIPYGYLRRFKENSDDVVKGCCHSFR
jgi:hypothetical protein